MFEDLLPKVVISLDVFEEASDFTKCLEGRITKCICFIPKNMPGEPGGTWGTRGNLVEPGEPGCVVAQQARGNPRGRSPALPSKSTGKNPPR